MVHYILDGYNIINRLSVFATGTLQARRQALVDFIEHRRPQGSSNNSVTIVFDGRADVGGFECSGTAEVFFTSDESADEEIKRLVEDHPNRKNITVVTDDKGIRYYVRSLGAKVLGVEEFMPKVPGTRPASREQSARRKDAKNISLTLEHKINTELGDLWLKKKKDRPQ